MTYHLGTSGWSYTGWKERFYPADLPAKDWLAFYAERFFTVEINMTFYRLPRPATLQGWVERTPPHFTFTLKANRRITHLKKLSRVEADVRYFYILADQLQEKLGCILFQLPPSLTRDLTLLEKFLKTLSPDYRNVIEFRHESWYDDEVSELLRGHGVTFCTVSSARVPPTLYETSSTGYFRFHGLTGGYRHDYSDEELRDWADRIGRTKAEDIYVYFNNDYQAFAVQNCLRLADLLQADQSVGGPLD